MPEVVITYKGRDEVSRGLKSAEASLKRTSTATGRLNKQAMTLNATTGRLTGGVKGLTGALGPAGLVGVAGLAAVALGTKLVGSVLSANAELSRMSTTLGVGSETLQEWAFAAGQTGTDLETISDASRTFSERILEVKQGSADAKEQFDLLGLSARELGRLTPEQQFRQLADAIEGVEDPSERVAIAQALLGDSGSELLNLFEDGSAGIDEYADRARELGLVLDEEAVEASRRASEAMGTLGSAFSGIVNQIVSSLAPTIEDIANVLTDEVVPVIVDEVVPVIREFAEENLPKLVDFIKDVLIPAFNTFLTDILPVVVDFAEGVIEQMGDIVDQFKDVIEFIELVFAGEWEEALGKLLEISEQWFLLMVSIPERAASGLLDRIIQPFEDAVNAIESGAETIGRSVGDAAGFAANLLTTLVEDGIFAVNDALEDAGIKAGTAGNRMDDLGVAAGDAKDDLDDLTTSTIGLVDASDALAQSTGRTARLLGLQAQLATVGTGELGLDPADISGLLTQINVAEAGLGLSQTPIADRAGTGRTGRTGRTVAPDDPAKAGETEEERRQRLLEEQRINLLNRGISGGSLELLLGLFENDLDLDGAGLRSARIAGGGQTGFERSLSNFLQQRSGRASGKRERDRATQRAADQAAREADKLAREAERIADQAERELQRQIDQQFANFADLRGLGIGTDEINTLSALFSEEVGLTGRERDTLRIGGGGRTPYEQALFNVQERLKEEEEEARKLAKAVEDGIKNSRDPHVCPPNRLTASETVRNLESPARRGTTRRSLVGVEGLC